VARRIERLIHLLLRERLGGQEPPDLSGSIMDAIDGKQAPVRKLPPAETPPPGLYQPWMAIAAGVAIVAALALAVSIWTLSRPEQGTTTADGNRVRVIPSEQDKANTSNPQPQQPVENHKPAPQPSPEPQPEDQVEKPAPEPQPEPQPEPEQPKPEKDPVVEKPEPQPQPEPQPEPEQPKPEKDPVVEKPEPQPQPQPEPERPPTETHPEKAVRLGSVVYAPDKSRLEWRLSADDKWADWESKKDVTAGLQLRARRPVAIELDDGARVYFDGEIKLSGDAKTLGVAIEDESVYFDVYGSKRDVTVTRGDAKLTFRDAELLAEKSGLRLQVSCLGGEVAVGDVTLKAGWTASLNDKGLSREKFEGDRARHNPLVASMDQTFVLMREELNRDAAQRVYHGDWKDGVVNGKGKELVFGIELSEDVELKKHAYLRMRVRINGDEKGLNIGFGSTEESDWRYFQSHHGDVQPGEWTIVRVPLEALMDDGDKKHIWPGVKLHKFQIVLWDKTDASVDVDWFELGIDPEWSGAGDKEDK